MSIKVIPQHQTEYRPDVAPETIDFVEPVGEIPTFKFTWGQKPKDKDKAEIFWTKHTYIALAQDLEMDAIQSSLKPGLFIDKDGPRREAQKLKDRAKQLREAANKITI